MRRTAAVVLTVLLIIALTGMTGAETVSDIRDWFSMPTATPAPDAFRFRDGIRWGMNQQQVKALEAEQMTERSMQNWSIMLTDGKVTVSRFTADLVFMFRDNRLLMISYEFARQKDADDFSYLSGALCSLYGEKTPAEPLKIKALMDDDYKSEHIQLSNAFSSDGCQYIYNNDKLPGFAFAVGDDDYYGISIMNGAKLNDKISSDMDYKQIADIVGDMEGMLVAQENNICCYAEVDGYKVVFCFIDNDYTRENRSGGNLSSSVLRSGNPSLQSIGLRKEKPSDPEPETERQKTENSFGMSDEEIKSMLTSDRWILREVYVDGEPYQGNFYGSITTKTGAYIEFKNDSTFNCVL